MRSISWLGAVVGAFFLLAASGARAQVPAVSLTASTPVANELGAVAGAFTLTRSGSTTASLSVSISRAGTAANGSDYGFVSSAVVIPVNQASVAIAISPLRDNLVEGEETVLFGLSPSASYTIATPDPVTVRLLDDPAIVQLVASTPSADEEGLVNGVFTVSRSGGDTSASLSVPLTRQGSAGNGSDYVFVSSAAILPANQTSLAIAIAPLADNLVEGEETVVFSLATTSTFVPGASSGGTVTIADDPAIVTLVATDVAANEAVLDPGRLVLTRRGGNPAQSLNVPLIRAGSAGNGSDHQFIPSALNFPANQVEAAIDVVPVRDNLVEGDENVIISLAASSTHDPGASTSGTVVIADDPAIVTFSASDPSAGEAGLDPGAFVVNRSGGDTSTSLNVAILRTGSASNGADYGFVSSGFVLAANVLTGSIPILPLADNLVEGAETVDFELQASSTYLAGTSSSGSITIADDPPVVSLGAIVPRVSECGTTPGRFAVMRGGGDRATSLSVALLRGGSATNGVDYPFLPSGASIPAGADEVQLPIAPLFDEIEEGDETVALSLLESPSTYLIASPSAATVTIENCVVDVFFDGFESAPATRPGPARD